MNPATDIPLVKLEPNPCVNLLRVTTSSSLVDAASISIYNCYGHSVLRTIIYVEAGKTETIIPTEDFPPGEYSLYYKTELSPLFIIVRFCKVESVLR